MKVNPFISAHGRISLLILLVAALPWLAGLSACHHAPEHETLAHHDHVDFKDNYPKDTDWDALADSMVDAAEELYTQDLHDSLVSQSARYMHLLRKHKMWIQYYHVWNILAMDYTFKGDISAALFEVKRMHEDATARQNKYGLALANYSMGLAYHYEGNLDEALRGYETSLSLFPRREGGTLLNSLFYYYTLALSEQKSYDKMAYTQMQWKDFIDRQVEKRGKIAQNSGNVWYYQYYSSCFTRTFTLDSLDAATVYLDSAYHYIQREPDMLFAQRNLISKRIQLLMKRKEYAEALKWSDQEVEMSKGHDIVGYTAALSQRSRILEHLGRYEEALRFYKERTELKDSVYQNDTRQQLDELNTRFEVDELHMEGLMMRNLYIAITASIVAVALAIVIALLVWFSRRLKRKNRKLLRMSAQLTESNAQLEEKNAELTEANERAEESSRMKTAFIQQMSHEIRTPLNILSGFTQVVTTPGINISDEEKEEINKGITANTDRITSLINKLLELSDASSHTHIERTDEVTPLQIATQAIDSSRISLAEHLHFETRYPQGAEHLLMHTNLHFAARALDIILDNARKFTLPAEALQTGKPLEKKETATLTIATEEQKNGKRVTFTVEDSGVGVPPDQAERIFDQFVQLDDYYDGTGIGLPLARSIARRLGGDITLDTSYTHGARFVMHLPLD